MDDAPPILVDRADGYAVLTLNRPAKMNAVSLALADAFNEALTDLADCPVVVITGAGRAFCAGVDLAERSQHRQDWRASFGVERSQYWADAVEAMRRHPAVFIAAVNGYALGGGLTLVNNAELAVAAETAEFGMPELGFGSFPAVAGPTSVRRILSKHVAQVVFLPGRIGAVEALRFGLVNEVVEPEVLLDRVREMAAQVARYEPIALAHTKRALRNAETMDWATGVAYGAEVSASIGALRADDQRPGTEQS